MMRDLRGWATPRLRVLAVAVVVCAAFTSAASGATLSGKLAFIAQAPAGPDGGLNEVFTVNPDGSGITQVSHRQTDSLIGLTPTWSPQADKLAYVEGCPCGTTTFYRIVVSNPDGSGRQVITTGTTADSQWAPSWSPDGHRIAFFEGSAATDQATLTLMNPDGSAKTSLPYHHLMSVSEHMSWSPDGKQITFNDASNKIWVANVDGSGETSIATGAVPDWSPDGTEIAYTENFGAGNAQIALVHPNGSGNVTIATGFQWAAWSPDGQHLVAAETTGPFSLVVMGANGSNQTPLGIRGVLPAWGGPRAAPAHAAPKCTLSSKGKVQILRKTSGAISGGKLAVRVSCDQAASVRLTGSLSDRPPGKRRVRHLRLPAINANVSAGVGEVLQLNLPVSAVKDLVSGAKEGIKLTLTAQNANGPGRATATISPLRK